MENLIRKLENGNLKGKRVINLAKLLYNKNGCIVTSNLHHIESAYKLRDQGILLSIKRVDYSSDHIISTVRERQY